MDEKTVLFDTVDASIGRQFLENVEAVLGGRALDYLVVNHMEPDHCSLIAELALRYPKMQIIGNAKTFPMIGQFYDMDLEDKKIIIKEGDTFSSGTHTLHFVMAPMVHWPEAMMTYDEADKVLFSADAFGTFGALGGTIFNDEIDFDRDWLDDARRYYTNIVGKYGVQVQNVLKKAAALDIRYTVSYTHLDVYKRQHIKRRPAVIRQNQTKNLRNTDCTVTLRFISIYIQSPIPSLSAPCRPGKI